MARHFIFADAMPPSFDYYLRAIFILIFFVYFADTIAPLPLFRRADIYCC
jgi:hypothetical protein